MISHYSHVIWDWNGTILDDAFFSYLKTCDVLKSNNLSIPDFSYYLDYFTFPVETFLKPLGLNRISKTMNEISSEFVSLYNNEVYQNCVLHSGITTILFSLKAHGITQYLFSAREQSLLEKDIEFYNVNEFFECVLGGKARSSHQGKLHRCKQLSGKLKQDDHPVIIGDTLQDWEVARELDIDCVLIAQGQNSFKVLQQSKNPYIFKNHKVLFSFFFEQNCV